MSTIATETETMAIVQYGYAMMSPRKAHRFCEILGLPTPACRRGTRRVTIQVFAHHNVTQGKWSQANKILFGD